MTSAAAPIDFHKIFLSGERLEIQFFQNRQKGAGFKNLHMDALETKPGFCEMEKIADHRGANPFAPVSWIDDRDKKSSGGRLSDRASEKECRWRQGLLSDQSGQARFEFGKSDPIFQSFLPFFNIRKDKRRTPRAVKTTRS